MVVCQNIGCCIIVYAPRLDVNVTDLEELSTSDILVIKIILVLVLVSFQSNHFYFM